MHYRHGKSVQPGTRPGALGDVAGAITSIWVMDYNTSKVNEQVCGSVDDVLAFGKSANTTWVHIQGKAGADDLRRLREAYGLHPLAVEDVMNAGQRPKFEPYDSQVCLLYTSPSPRD